MTELTAWNKIKSCILTFKSKKQRGESVQVDFTAALNLPIVFNPVLDETLNTAQIVLSDLRRKDYEDIFTQHGIDVTKAFEVETIVRIKFQKPVGGSFVDQNAHIDMFIAHDDSRMERKSEGEYRSYKHNIKLIEFTKQLEREPVDTLTFTNPVLREYDARANVYWDYTKGFTRAFSFGVPGGRGVDLGENFLTDYCGWRPPDIPMMLQKQSNYQLNDNLSTVNTNAAKQAATMYVRELILTITTPSNRTYNYSSPLTEDHQDGDFLYYKDSYIPIQLNEVGEYKADIRIQTYANFNDGIGYRLCEFYYATSFAVSSTGEELHPYKFNESIERLLSVTPTRLVSEGPKYVFDKAQLDNYAGEESPEFAFTDHTLFEALYQMSSYKGAFPVLEIDEAENRTVSFRTMWNGKRLTDEELPPPLDDISSSDIEQYCTNLETSVQNLVGVNNSQVGTLTEPYKSGWKSTRSSGGSAITQDTATISTEYNMYLHIAENFGIVYDGSLVSYDITPYIYESGDYEGLSDHNASYPSSKAYALKWGQMESGITELAHKINSSASEIARAFTQPAISNIIQAKTGINYNTGIVAYISSLFSIKKDENRGYIFDADKAFGGAELLFKTQYIPVINARVRQYKENFADFSHPGAIKYNQTAELVDSEMFGEHLKELMRKLGNRVFQRIYKFNSLDDVPEVGTLVGEYSIYDIQMSVRENRINAAISFVKYAELSQFIGVKNAWKDSDVSIDKCYERQISYNEFLLFTRDKDIVPTSTSLSSGSAAMLKKFMPAYSPNQISCAMATGYTKEGDELNTVLLPVVSLAIGNSVLFHWKYQNNYSAGYMSQKAPKGATSIASGTAYDRAQQAVKYADSYGRLETLSYKLMLDGPVAEECAYSEDGGATFVTDVAEVTRHIAHSLPLMPPNLYRMLDVGDGAGGTYKEAYEYGSSIPVGTYISVDKLVVEKNSSEALTIDTQIHFVTDITSERGGTDFIIGSGLANFCPLVGGSAFELSMYGFKEPINIFNRHILVGEATYLPKPQFEIVTRGNGHCLKVTLPSMVNDVNPDGTKKYQAWAYVGRAKNGANCQIIFGENKGLDLQVDFNEEFYVLAMHKEEDII